MPNDVIQIRVSLARQLTRAALDRRLPYVERAAYLRAAWHLLRDVATE
jgi:hypothetical protein